MNLLYPVFYSGRFFTPKDMKRVNPRLMTIINESFEGVNLKVEPEIDDFTENNFCAETNENNYQNSLYKDKPEDIRLIYKN